MNRHYFWGWPNNSHIRAQNTYICILAEEHKRVLISLFHHVTSDEFHLEVKQVLVLCIRLVSGRKQYKRSRPIHALKTCKCLVFEGVSDAVFSKTSHLQVPIDYSRIGTESNNPKTLWWCTAAVTQALYAVL